INGTSQVYMAVSSNHGATWGPPVRVTAATPSLQTNLFAWVAAGDPGRVDVVWYGTPTLGSCPNQPCGSGAITAHWQGMLAQSLNAIVNGAPNPNPSFITAQVSEVSNHFVQICTFGIGCTTGGDRGLLDFTTVEIFVSSRKSTGGHTQFFRDPADWKGRHVIAWRKGLARAPSRNLHNFVVDDQHADQHHSRIGFDRPSVNDLASATPFRRGFTGDFFGDL